MYVCDLSKASVIRNALNLSNQNHKLLQLSPLGAANLFAKEFKKRGKISDSREHHF